MGLELYTKLMDMLWQDCLDGKVSPSEKQTDGLQIEIETLLADLYLTLTPDSTTAQWLNQLDKSLG
jgi:hypothetical protein